MSYALCSVAIRLATAHVAIALRNWGVDRFLMFAVLTLEHTPWQKLKGRVLDAAGKVDECRDWCLRPCGPSCAQLQPLREEGISAARLLTADSPLRSVRS